MKIVKRINNNAALCLDSRGQQVVAFGRGVGFTDVGSEVPLSKVERTFYNVDDRAVALVREISPDVLRASGLIVDEARSKLPYDLSRNAILALADHIAFAIERKEKRLMVQMPLSIEVKQNYPIEFAIGVHAVELIDRELGVRLSEDEAIGIALSIINGAYADGQIGSLVGKEADVERVLEQLVRCIERRWGIKIDRGSFEYGRFATHMHYLFRRVLSAKEDSSDQASVYDLLAQQLPRVASCVDDMCSIIHRSWDCRIGEGEKTYLMLHVNRMLQNRH